MSTLAEIQKGADSLCGELSRAATLGAIPPTSDEICDFLCDVMDAENDDCERCTDEITPAAREFSRVISLDDVEYTAAFNALVALLAATEVFSKRDARVAIEDLISCATLRAA